MPRLRSLGAKIGAVGLLLLVAALGSIALTLSFTWRLEGGAAAVNEAGRMRMLTWELGHTLARGDADAAARRAARMEQGLKLLHEGDAERPLAVPHDERTRAALAAVGQGWQALRARWLDGAPPGTEAVARDAQAQVQRIDVLVDRIEERLSQWTAWLHAVQLSLLGLAIAAAVALLYSAYLFVFEPLNRLREGLRRAEQGDLAARVSVPSADEFGEVAEGFNQMAATLQELYQGLEARVQAKTLEVQAQARRLATLYEAASEAARAQNLESLAQAFARQMKVVTGASAAAVRWADETGSRRVLLAQDGMPAELAQAEHCLQVGDCHCGQLPADARTRVIPIAPADPGGAARPAGGCRAFGLTHLLSIPVRLHERLLGEIDLFFVAEPALGKDERGLLDTLASHLAGAMEALRAQAMDREAAVAGERGLLARELHDSIAQSLAFLKIQVQLLRDAMRHADSQRTAAAVDEIDTGIRGCTADVRELLLHFRTRTNAEDIVPALQATLQKFEHHSGIPAHLSVGGQGLPLAPDDQTQLLHVVQEALSNVRKHAGASRVWVNLEQGEPLRVEVRDDGEGFDADRAADETHVGLRIMRERAQRIGAQVQVHSRPGQGTRVVLTLARPAHSAVAAPATVVERARAAGQPAVA